MVRFSKYLRKKQNLRFRGLLVFFWIISASHTLLLPAFTISNEETQAPIIQGVHNPAETFMSLFLQLIFDSTNANAHLADTQDDSTDKVDFITTRHHTGHPPINPGTRKNSHHVARPQVLPLEKNTPPPRHLPAA